MLTLLHHGAMLNWLDAVMLRVVGAAGIPTVQDSAQPSRDMPVVLLLGDNLYERAFHQESPLDRAQLANLIDTIAGQCPSILAVDIDLSPGPADAPSNRSQSTLDRALLATLKPEVCQSSTALILSTPVPVNTSELVEQKFQWMKRACEAGVRFAFTDVFLSQGAIVQFDPELPTLGVLAARPNLPQTPCKAIARGKSSADFLRKTSLGRHLGRAEHFASQTPFNAKFFRAEDTNRHLLTATDALPVAVAGRAVFLGGGFGLNDRFRTAFGEREGAVIHAAAYFSIRNKVGKVERWGAFLLDVALGFAFGYLFHLGWCGHALATQRLHALGSAPWLGAYLKARAWLIGNFALLVVSATTLVVLSALVFFPRSMWVNPGPIILGVFIYKIAAGEPRRSPY